ncbi:MAG: histidinol-phosphate transaminase [Alphaproteobacteria bacterium]|nr:histidinol-phosphate transaminase [Alphaproteobacteria bacterium]
MSGILSLVRSDLAGFAGYSSAAKESDGFELSIKLDANESPWLPFGEVSSLCPVNRYAEPQPAALHARMSAAWGINPQQLLLTCGSDQGIDILLRLFCTAGLDEILVCPPTFSMYEVYARLQGAKVLSVPLLENGQLDMTAIFRTITNRTKLIFIPAPNAPMGHAMNKDDILALCAERNGKSLIVVDEAYAAFSNDPDGVVPVLGKIPNLVILRTLSKAYALAGERVGCVIGEPKIIEALSAIIPPYPLAQSAVRAALDTLSPTGLAQTISRLKILKSEKKYLAEKLYEAEGVVRIYPSETNFLFVETTGAKDFMERLRRFGIQIRNMEYQKTNAVRISIGKPEENDFLLMALGVKTDRVSQSLRSASVQRKTKETAIDVFVDLDNRAQSQISTGIPFFDHMLYQVAVHGNFFLSLHAQGDLHIDNHHTIEDCALALGEAMNKALGDKKGLARFGFIVPMDESLANVVLDLSGRPFAQIEMTVQASPCDGMGIDLAEHFFRSFAVSLGATLHIKAVGTNNHHVIEASFKALGRALQQALVCEGSTLPSTKGVL